MWRVDNLPSLRGLIISERAKEEKHRQLQEVDCFVTGFLSFS